MTLLTLTSFNGFARANPSAGLIADANGDLFGTTVTGIGYGTVFEIVNNGTVSAPSYAGTPTVLVIFDSTDGSQPYASLLADAKGDLFGTTYQGGLPYGFGTVFEIVNNGTVSAPSYASSPSTLVSFSYTTGRNPLNALIADAKGDLFGTTDGTVFEIVNNGTVSAPSYASSPTTLVSFDGSNGSDPEGLIADANGDLFGTTHGGGPSNNGTVFELVKSGSTYTLDTLINFDGTDGGGSVASLIADAKGDLFGMTAGGGAGEPNADGTVFEIVNNGTVSAPSYASSPTTLVSFDGTNGANPSGGLIADANGDLFGTTSGGGTYDDGTVFELINNGGGSYTLNTLLTFDGSNGKQPEGSLLADTNGDLFGTTVQGGASDEGTVFEVTGSGFVVADNDSGEQAALSVAVNGGTPIRAAVAVATPFAVAGIENDDNGSVTFSDGVAAHNQTVAITNGELASNTVNLSGLNDGPITATLHLNNDAASNSFTNVSTTATLDQDKVAETPIFTAPSSLTIPAGGSIPLGMVIGALDADDALSVAISGVPGFETVTAAGATPTITNKGGTYTYTFSALPASDWNNGLILHSTYPGKGHPTNPLTIVVSNTTGGELSTAPSKTISVTDPAASSADNFARLVQYMASFGAGSDGHGGTLITDPPPNQEQFLAQPHA